MSEPRVPSVTGELWKVRENGATTGVGVLATYAYDDRGRRTSLTRGNGTTTSYGFDAASRLSSLAEDVGGTSYDQTLGFTYTLAGQIATNNRGHTANRLDSFSGRAVRFRRSARTREGRRGSSACAWRRRGRGRSGCR